MPSQRWDPEAIIAGVFRDREVRKRVREGVFGHPDWLELDRGTLDREDAIRRAAARLGMPDTEIRRLLVAVPPSLVPIAQTVDLLYRLKAGGYPLYCLSNMHFASIEHLEREQRFFEVFRGIVISCRVKLCKPEPAIYAHALVGMVTFVGQWWIEARKPGIEEVANHLAALAWMGLRHLPKKPALVTRA